MPGARTVLVALALGVGVTIYLEVVVRWPTFVNVGIGAVMALVALLIAASVGEDPVAADAAWREAAPDLQIRHLGPSDEALGQAEAGPVPTDGDGHPPVTQG